MNLLQIYCRVGYCKNFENRIIVSEVMAKSLVSCFLTHGVVFGNLFLALGDAVIARINDTSTTS